MERGPKIFLWVASPVVAFVVLCAVIIALSPQNKAGAPASASIAAANSPGAPAPSADVRPQDLVAQIRASSHDITDASREGKTITVHVNAGAGFSTGSLISDATMTTTTIGKVVKAVEQTAPSGVKIIHIQFETDLQDKYGNPSHGAFMGIDMPVAELVKVNYDNIVYANMLDFGRDLQLYNVAGREAFEDFCRQKADVHPEVCITAR